MNNVKRVRLTATGRTWLNGHDDADDDEDFDLLGMVMAGVDPEIIRLERLTPRQSDRGRARAIMSKLKNRPLW